MSVNGASFAAPDVTLRSLQTVCIGGGVVTYSVAANPGTASRKGTITIAGQIFAIKQKGNVSNGGSGGGKP